MDSVEIRENINLKRGKSHFISHPEDQCCHLNSMVTKNAATETCG